MADEILEANIVGIPIPEEGITAIPTINSINANIIANQIGSPEEGNIKDDDDDDDIINGTDDNDLIVGGTGGKTLYGNKGEDTLQGGTGGNVLYGGKDDDTCIGGEGNDVASGDDGDDMAMGNGGDDRVTGDVGDDTAFGGKGNDRCEGGDGTDWVHGNQDDDDVSGGDGNDTLYGGKGNDVCDGDDGNDTISGDRGNDTCSGGEGDDNISGGGGNDSIVGEQGSDTCIGGDGNDVADGGDDNDSIVGGGGDDTLMGGDGNDACSGNEGEDSISGDAGDDSLLGGDGNDVCEGGAGDDSLVGDSGKDTLVGGTGNDACDGGTGSDSIVGGDGNDTCLGDDGDDTILGGGGDDSLNGGAGNDAIAAGQGNNSLEGGAGDDSLEGGDGDNSLSGGEGNDTLTGGTGNHTCVGGAGNDVFIIKNVTSGGKSTIADYTDNSDKFLLAGDFSFSSLSFVQVGVNTEIRGSSNFVLAVLLNVSATVLEASDFFQGGGSTTSPVGTTNTPPVLEANKELAIAAGGFQTITVESLRFFDSEDGVSGITYKITQLPTAAQGQLFYNGQAITSTDFTFTQLDINLRLLTFQAAAGFTGDASFSFDVSDGKTTISGQRLKISVVNTIFNFVGNTTPQVITGSPLGDDIQAGDGGDDIKGGIGNDKIKGGTGDDKIEGGDDDDEIEGSEGKNTLTGGAGRDRFIYRKARQGVNAIADADLITDFNASEDSLEFSAAAFGNISISSFTKLTITSSFSGIIGSSNFLDFSDDTSVTDIASLQARFAALGGNSGPVFCQFTDATTGRSVLVFSIGTRFEIVAQFSARITLNISNFVFSGPSVTVPLGTAGADIVNLGTFPAPVKYDGLGGNDSIIGSDFDDEIDGGEGDDYINGGKGKDKIKGGLGNDQILGSEADDSLYGDDGDDTIIGGIGRDWLTGGTGADVFSYIATKEGGDKIVGFTSGTDKFQFVSAAFGNLNSSNFDLVNITSPTTDITGKELLIFSGTYASLASLQTQFAALPGAGTSPVFSFFQNAAGEGVLVFDVDGTGSASAVEIANLGTGVTGLGTADFLFNGTVPTPIVNSTTSIVNLTAAGNTYPTGNLDFSNNVGGYGFTGPLLFIGDANANNVTGTAFADFMTGAGGADFFTGGLGGDILTGGEGADIFGYKLPTEGGDTITDFIAGVDKFQFVAAAFGNLTTGNFDAVSGVSPDIADKELVIFTGGTYATFEDAQAKAIGVSTSPGFFAFTNAANETLLVFDSNGTTTGGFTTVATLKNGPVNLGSADFVFSGTIAPTTAATTTTLSSIADLTAAGNTYPTAFNDFSTGVGGYSFSGPVLFTGNASNNSVLGTAFNDTIFGGEGDDSMSGGNGSDSLSGGIGNDTLIGGFGTDALDGGVGNDVFVFNGTDAAGSDFITNYSTADDLIRLDSVGFSGFGTGPLGSGFYVYNSTGSTVAQIETTLTSPAIVAIYDGTVSKLYYDSNGSTVGGNSLFATVDANFGVSGNSQLFLF